MLQPPGSRPKPPTFRGATLIRCLQTGPRAAARWATEAAIPAGSRSAAVTGRGCGVAPSVPAKCEGRPQRQAMAETGPPVMAARFEICVRQRYGRRLGLLPTLGGRAAGPPVELTERSATCASTERPGVMVSA